MLSPPQPQTGKHRVTLGHAVRIGVPMVSVVVLCQPLSGQRPLMGSVVGLGHGLVRGLILGVCPPQPTPVMPSEQWHTLNHNGPLSH